MVPALAPPNPQVQCEKLRATFGRGIHRAAA
jgi:hypothetical protein